MKKKPGKRLTPTKAVKAKKRSTARRSRDDLGWSFPTDPANQWDGFNNDGIEHFRSNPFGNFAREIIQNSLDAVKDPDQAIHINFRLQKVETDDLPGLADFKTIINRCLKSAGQESEKAKLFFESAKELIAKKQLTVLSVEETNTKGIAGPCENGSPYFAFLKAKGQSRKDSDTATGSYGIGKNAPFAVSELRTIFVSTVFSNGNGRYEMYTQGKSILM